jgi:hypothetical protein
LKKLFFNDLQCGTGTYRPFSNTQVFEKGRKAKITLFAFAGQDAPMPRAQGCARAAGLRKGQEGLFSTT